MNIKKFFFSCFLGSVSILTSCGRNSDSDAAKDFSTDSDSVAESRPLAITSEREFYNLVNSDTLTLVDFYATWCRPCRAMHPILEKVATDMSLDVKVAKVDVDQNGGLAQQFSVQSIPTLLLFKKGSLVWSHVGMSGYDELKNVINQKK